ncbi:MAG: hypothetical protein CVU14_07115 [Bacteroidetes bacterium HGW-Bacteroidetes-9]|jgi:acylphosphatase|nr:MAG: hypothetical protein CVU14_07115 [Bacteroidetes bacterium HGW-Bacteroidetes-9]
MRIAQKIIINTGGNHAGFRYYALKKGREMGISGTISLIGNSGNIAIHAEGSANKLETYANTLRLGSEFCKVNSVMSIPDRMQNNLYLNILPVQPDSVSRQKHSKLRSFRIGLFGF